KILRIDKSGDLACTSHHGFPLPSHKNFLGTSRKWRTTDTRDHLLYSHFKCIGPHESLNINCNTCMGSIHRSVFLQALHILAESSTTQRSGQHINHKSQTVPLMIAQWSQQPTTIHDVRRIGGGSAFTVKAPSRGDRLTAVCSHPDIPRRNSTHSHI